MGPGIATPLSEEGKRLLQKALLKKRDTYLSNEKIFCLYVLSFFFFHQCLFDGDVTKRIALLVLAENYLISYLIIWLCS